MSQKNKTKPKDKPLSLHPLKIDYALEIMLNTKPPKKEKGKPKKK
ncbi:hypothetical protein ACFL6I_04090 [candidate division KSB1 bacterium]